MKSLFEKAIKKIYEIKRVTLNLKNKIENKKCNYIF